MRTMKSDTTKKEQRPGDSLTPWTPGVGVGTQMSYALYSAANRIVRLHRPLLEPLGLTYPQYLVMVTLYASTPRAVGEIGAALDLETGTLTPLLKRLEAAGLVTRTRDPADDRRVLVELTEKGRSLRGEVELIPSTVKTKCLLSEAELAVLRDTLHGLARSLDG
jgi:MarR family transcriptional regulator, organic hydroperoxide resistance regulator